MDNYAMPDATFTLRVMEFKNFRAGQGDCPYIIAPPSDLKPEIKLEHGHRHPWYKVGPRVSLHVGHYQKDYTYKADPRIPTTVRLEEPHAVLQFEIVDKNNEKGRYFPVGMAFLRADETHPIGTPFTTSAKKAPMTIQAKPAESPFSKLKLNDPLGTIEIDVERISQLYSIRKGSEKASHRTYRCIVFIQESETGIIGVIDPEIEPPI